MSWFARLFGGERRGVKTAPPRDPVIAEWWGSSSLTATGLSITPNTAMRSAAVYACVRVLTDTISTLPVHLFEKTPNGGRRQLNDHPLTMLIGGRPHRALTSVQWRQMAMAHVALRGNAYAEIVMANDGRITELVPLPPDRVRAFWAPDGRRAYEYQPEIGPRRILLQSEMLHLMGLSVDGLKGLNPIELHRETIGLSMAAHEYGARFFGNNAAPKGALKMPGTLNDEAAKILRESWERRHKGLENAHRIAILDAGMEFVPVGMSNEDAQYIQTMGFTAVDITRIFRVPPHKIGILDRATFTNIEHQALEFVTDTVLPIAISFESALNNALLTEEERRIRYFKFNLAGLLRGDFKSRMEGYAIGRNGGWLSANDILRSEDMDPIANGDVYLTPLNMAPSDKLLDVLLKTQPSQKAN